MRASAMQHALAWPRWSDRWGGRLMSHPLLTHRLQSRPLMSRLMLSNALGKPTVAEPSAESCCAESPIAAQELPPVSESSNPNHSLTLQPYSSLSSSLPSQSVLSLTHPPSSLTLPALPHPLPLPPGPGQGCHARCLAAHSADPVQLYLPLTLPILPRSAPPPPRRAWARMSCMMHCGPSCRPWATSSRSASRCCRAWAGGVLGFRFLGFRVQGSGS